MNRSHAPKLTLVRKCGHDLPPRWDGRIVEWSEWDTSSSYFVCGPRAAAKREPCHQCRSDAQPLMCRGTVFPLAGEKATVDRLRRTKSGREYVAGTIQAPARPHLSLVVLRCPDCNLDMVLDRVRDQWWTLDASDYGDDGSAAP